MKRFEHLPLASLLDQFQSWKNILDHHMTGHIFFLPHTGMLYRMYQFSEWLNSTSNQSYRLVNMDLELIRSPFELNQLLSGQELPTILIAGKNFLSDNKIILTKVLQANSVQQNNSLLVVHECSPQTIAEVTELPSIMYHNHFCYKLPTLTVMSEYIHNITHEWGVKLTAGDSADIISYCGNQLWLTNEIIRLKEQSNDTVKNLILHPNIQKRTEELWNYFPTGYINYFFDNLSNPTLNKQVRQELSTFGYLDHQTGKSTGQWLTNLIARKKYETLSITKEAIIANQTDNSIEFSPGEKRILAHLFESHTTLSRETIAIDFWQEEVAEQFSDWALDAIMSRLRKKIVKLHLPIIIKTSRGVGYVLAK